MRWVIQDNLYDEDGYVRFIDSLDRMGEQYDIVKVIPFAHELSPDIDYSDEHTIVMGSDALVKVSEKKGWKPGAFTNENFDHRVWQKIYGNELLNHEAKSCKFKDINPKELTEFFIRPALDFKVFAGTKMNQDDFVKWQDKVISYSGKELSEFMDITVIISPLKNILQEYRFFIVDGRIVAHSTYKVGGRVTTDVPVDRDAVLYAQQMSYHWRPHVAYVMDVARVTDGFKVIEFNCINSAGFYAADCQNIISSIRSLVKYKDYDNYTTDRLTNNIISSPINYPPGYAEPHDQIPRGVPCIPHK